eukprot:TRINITY_DN20317_c0_g1_i1.p2 TRINITY_DN20317_c0_g1~~TRINITY_DN20317_c0_g1_i1.p2  ORF type:complete len:485 (+),score=212.62 TRINITY_DN20317_c0_g1_i1:54-1508(+)
MATAAVLALACGAAAAPIDHCTEHFYTQKVDHFGYRQDAYFQTFQQRYFVCGEAAWAPGQPIFFYLGNEADVSLYIKHTGLMWENKDQFGALLLFAEHRYFGKSLPFGANSSQPANLHFLSHEQGLADYAALMHDFKQRRQTGASKVIGFGGSYGGMLAAWMRMKYPHVVDGVIAGSAPILAFAGVDPTGSYKTTDATFGQGFWDVVTADATPAHGARKNCDVAVRKAFAELFAADAAALQKTFKTCTLPDTPDKVTHVAYLQMFAWDNMAMGNFPYPSDYLTGGTGHNLPTFPVRAACRELVDEAGAYPEGAELLEALNRATSLFNNASKDKACYPLDFDLEQDGAEWDWMFCTEMSGQETYYARNGATDMFWASPFNISFINDRCMRKYGVRPRTEWIDEEYLGGKGVDGLKAYSNMVFSNGLYDPWSSAGVLRNVSDSVVAVVLKEGAHHLDLMFSTKDDPPEVTAARAFEVAMIRKWIEE